MYASSGAGTAAVNWAAVVVLGLPILAVYLLPTWIGWARRIRQLPAVVIINVLLGWTVIGWVGALTLAVWRAREESSRVSPPPTEPSPGPDRERIH